MVECGGFIVVCVAVWLLVWRFDPNVRRWREYKAELAVLQPTSDADLVSGYFAAGEADPNVPADVRRVFAKHTGYPSAKLLPDDDLAFFWAELDMADLINELESSYGIAITDEDAERTPCTIRAVSRLVSEKAFGTAQCTD